MRSIRHTLEQAGTLARKRITGYAGVLLVAILAAFLLKTFVIGAIRVPSGSMENALLPGDCVLINKLVYGPRTPEKLPFSEAKFPELRIPGLRKIARGDVIVFSFPGEADGSAPDEPVYFVKRGVVPARGDSVTLTSANFSLWENLIRREGHDIRCGERSGVTIDGIPAKKYGFEKNYLFVLGDNRDRSYDSRAWGFLPEENVIGEAMMVYWSSPGDDPGSGGTDAPGSVRWDRIGMFVR